jgi:dTDP-3-amino-3,4,6-trideoxy-alpha-D-glucose transaminase
VSAPPAPIPFIDLRPDDDDAAVRAAITRVLERGWFVLGPEVEAFEREFAAASGAAFAVGVGTGTDAITLALRALDIGTGDEVIVPAMTAAFTALGVIAAGATPVIVDVEPDTLTINPAATAAAVTVRTRAIVPVHLYGQPADMESLRLVAARHSLAIVEDCCQAHLATECGVAVGTRSEAAAFSFYPTKNLGALGDGGAVVTRDEAIASRVRRLRNGGQQTRSQHVEAGVNSRLDDLQAAVLRARLPLLPEWTIRRRTLAARYRRLLPPALRTIRERDPGHVYHLFPVLLAERETLRQHLASAGIETMVHYPMALTKQPAFAAFASHECPVAAAAAEELLSLPLSPRLTDADIVRVAEDVAAFVKGQRLA